jgi:hypothetical protein
VLAKLLSLLTTAKGAAAATLVAAAAVGGGVVAADPDVRDAIGGVVQGITSPTSSELRAAEGSGRPSGRPSASPSGQPPVVAARNNADQDLRRAFQDDQQALEKLRGTRVEGSDRDKLSDIVRAADDKLRARLTKALNDVAALTLGREGRESPRPSGSPDVRTSFTPAAQAQIDGLVKTATTEMAAIVNDAEKAVAALPTAAPGRPSGSPNGGRPSENPGGRPSSSPGAGRPNENPSGGRPSETPRGGPPSPRP